MLATKKLTTEKLEVRTLLAATVTPDIVPCEVSTVSGDANCDGKFNSSDLVQIMQAGEYEDDVSSHFEHNSTWSEGDFDGDGDFTTRDLVHALQNSVYEEQPSDRCQGSSTIGDANCDGVFNSSDLVEIMQAGEYEDDVSSHFEHNSTWFEGDFDGDGDFTSGDLVFALQNSIYVH